MTTCASAEAPGHRNEIVCPSCNNVDSDKCPACDDGWLVIPGCPNEFCSEVIEAGEVIDLFHKGLPPIGGGSLEQSAWFLTAAQLLKSYENQFRQQRASQ